MAGKTIDRNYDASAARVYEACRRAVGELGYTVIFSDASGMSISFNTGRSMKTWGGQDLTATVFADGKGSKVVIGGSIAKSGNPFGGNQIGSWGEKTSLSNKFHDKITELLPSISEPAKGSSSGEGLAEEIAKLKALHDQGILSKAEFDEAKKKLLK